MAVLIDPAEFASVWTIAIHVIAGGEHIYLEPKQERYRGHYATEALCKKAPKPSTAAIERAAPFFVTVKGATCREHQPAKVK